jgi:transglutaminase-like putative cysteine protease
MRRSVVLLFAVSVVTGLLAIRAQAGQQWPPVTDVERGLAQPLIEATADAEVLLWDVTITVTDNAETIFDTYLRIKIFTERGRDAESKVDLSFGGSKSLRDIRGRTTGPDGSVTELAPGDIRERTMLEASGIKLKAQSFVLPAAVPGSIIEYRWREVRAGQLGHHLVLPFQRQSPVHLVRYRIKPLPLPGYSMRTHVFNATSPPDISTEPGGYSVIQVKRVPAVRAELYMPREMSVGAWMFLYYANRDWDLPEQQFWEKWSKEQAELVSGQLKLNGDLTKAATQATAGATTPSEKAQALVRFIRQRVRLGEVPAGNTPASARDVLKRGVGTNEDIVVLFTALARAAGLEAHLARMPDRELFVAAPRLKQPYFLSQLTSAVKTGTGWVFYDAANERAPAGRLRWQQEGTYALVLDGAAPTFLGVAFTAPEFSQARRTGALRLLPNGDLDGDVTITYSGHFATRYREQVGDETADERERVFSQRLTTSLPRAVLSNYRIENLDDPDKPLVVRFSLAVSGFAERTGTRLRLRAAVLPWELLPVFGAARRTRPVHFPFAWEENDALTIQLPEGYELEATIRNPAPLTMTKDVGRFAASTVVAGRTLTFNRSLRFGQGSLVFPVEEYMAVKAFFDGARAGDGGGLLLRRAGDSGAQ